MQAYAKRSTSRTKAYESDGKYIPVYLPDLSPCKSRTSVPRYVLPFINQVCLLHGKILRPRSCSTDRACKMPGVYRKFGESVFFFRNLNWKHVFIFFLSIFEFQRISENFRNASMQGFTKYCFQCIIAFCRVIFRAFESVKLNELGSLSLHGNIRRPVNPYEDRLTTNQIFIQLVQPPY